LARVLIGSHGLRLRLSLGGETGLLGAASALGLLALAAILLLAELVGHAGAGTADGREGLLAGAQERGELTVGDGEAEGGVSILTPREEGIDAEHPAAGIDQWPAAVAARDIGGVEKGADAGDAALVGEDALRAGGRERADIIAG